MRGPVLRALRLLAAFVALVAIALVANRWHASRALDAARARSEALGLRIDPTEIADELSPEARAVVLAARETCDEISDRAHERYFARQASGAGTEDDVDALTRDEAHRDAAVLEAAAIRFLAAEVPNRSGVTVSRERSATSGDAPEMRVNPIFVRNGLVEHLSGAARVAIARGAHAEGWRWIGLAARVCATQRGSDMLGVSSISLMMHWLTAAYHEAVAAAPDEPAREGVRAALREVDVVPEARLALRNDASMILSMVDAVEALGGTHAVRWRLVAVDLRDQAMLHRTWVEIVEASELPTTAELSAALAAIEARIDELPRSYALTHLTVARAMSCWSGVETTEAELTTLLAE
jgi:hypothetical protein